jgi:adenine phosphoribosyltransferase
MKTKLDIEHEIEDQLRDERIKLVWDHIGTVNDWPREGILFFDLLPVFANPKALKALVILLKEQLKDIDFDYVAAFESRGFLMAQPLAYELGIPFVPLRKKGKIPPPVVSEEYELEYGVDSVELKATNDLRGKKIVLMDDLLATGGTMTAGIRLVEKQGGIIQKLVFILDLKNLHKPSKELERAEAYSVLSLSVDE